MDKMETSRRPVLVCGSCSRKVRRVFKDEAGKQLCTVCHAAATKPDLDSAIAEIQQWDAAVDQGAPWEEPKTEVQLLREDVRALAARQDEIISILKHLVDVVHEQEGK